MDDRRYDDADSCALCGEDVYADEPTSYVLPDATTICCACALRLGGVFDVELEHWTQAPDLSRANLRRADAAST